MVRALRRDWYRHLVLVRAETVVRWQLGRPRLSNELRELIATLARENPRWGTDHMRGERPKLGSLVSNRSVRRSSGRGPAHSPRLA